MSSKYDFGWTKSQLMAELRRLKALPKEKRQEGNVQRALRDIARALQRVS